MENKSEKDRQNNPMDNFVKTDDILNDMCKIIESSQKAAYTAVNIALVQRNWLLGYRIASEELKGMRELNMEWNLLRGYQISLLRTMEKALITAHCISLFAFIKSSRRFWTQ